MSGLRKIYNPLKVLSGVCMFVCFFFFYLMLNITFVLNNAK